MSENTKIEWATHSAGLLCCVHRLVARLAESDPVREVQSQIGKAGKGLDVMSVQVPATGVTAVLAREEIPEHHVVAPALVGLGEPLTVALSVFPIDVAMALGSPRCPLSHDLADSGSRLGAMPLPEPLAGSSSRRCAHGGPSFRRVRAPLERGDPSSQRRVGVWSASAGLAARRASIVPGSIRIKKSDRLPLLATRAALQPGGPSFQELAEFQAGLLGRDLQGAFGGLSHEPAYRGLGQKAAAGRLLGPRRQVQEGVRAGCVESLASRLVRSDAVSLAHSALGFVAPVPGAAGQRLKFDCDVPALHIDRFFHKGLLRGTTV